MLPMAPGLSGLHSLMHPWVQLVICLPVYVAGMLVLWPQRRQKSAERFAEYERSDRPGRYRRFWLQRGRHAFGLGPAYQFYETAAAIITIVCLGYYYRGRLHRATQRSLKKLAVSQKMMANMIAFDDQHQEILFPVESTQLRSGDLVLIRSGEPVPADCKILWGEAGADESILTGKACRWKRQPKTT